MFVLEIVEAIAYIMVDKLPNISIQGILAEVSDYFIAQCGYSYLHLFF